MLQLSSITVANELQQNAPYGDKPVRTPYAQYVGYMGNVDNIGGRDL